MKRFLPILLAPACLFSSCFHKKIVKKETLPEVEVTAKKDNPYRATTTRLWEITNTKVALSFDWKGRRAEGREWIDLHPYAYPADTITLDAKGMKVDSVSIFSAGTYSPLAFTHADDQLKIRLGRNLNVTDGAKIYIRYTAMPYESPTGGSAAITDDRGLYFINTDFSISGKPGQIWTQGETESNSHWMPTLDKPNTRFPIQIELTVPDTMQTLSNGYKVSSTPAGHGLRTDIWKQEIPIQAYAAMFAIGRFDILKDEWKGKEVNYYVEPEYTPYGREIFKNTPEMMEYFSKITGIPYPWNKYDQVIVRDYVSGAMENTTASLFGEFMNENHRELQDKDFEDVVSHELFHQWFGDYVTCESWSNITVNESFANYSEQLWRRYKYGEASADKLAYDDLNKYLSYSLYTDDPLVRFYYDDRERVFDPISYEKGGAILHYMHSMMGDAAFSKAMNIYLTKNALHSAEAQNWRLAVEEATGQDWNWFFKQWYYAGGHPALEVRYAYNDSAKEMTATVQQKQDDSTFMYRLPLKAALVYGNEVTVFDWNVSKKKEVFSYPYKNGIRPVLVPDYSHWLPGSLAENKTPEAWLEQYTACDDYINRRKAVSNAFKDIVDSSSQVLVNSALNDKMVEIRRFTLVALRSLKSDRWHDKWKEQVIYMAKNDPSKNVCADAFDLLNGWKVAEAKPDMLSAVHDSSYAVAGAALAALNAIDSNTAYAIAREMLKTNPRAELDAAIWDIIGRKGEENDIELFIKRAPYYYGTKKFQFAIGLVVYLKNVKNDVSFDQGLSVLADLAINEGIKGYRSGLSSYLLQLGKEYKSRAEADHGSIKEHDKQRIGLIRTYIEKVMASEKDAENTKKLKEGLDNIKS